MILKRKQDTWTSVPNEILRSGELSLKAIGLLAYLFSLPEDWEVYQTELVKHFKDGLDSIRSGFRELEEAGYIKKVILREDGKFSNTSWMVTSCPYEFSDDGSPKREKPNSVLPISEKPVSENPTLLKTNNTNNLKNKELIKGATNLDMKVPFDIFWDMYDKKVGGRDKCRKKWDELKLETQYNAIKHIEKYVKSTPDKKYRANPETYLNQKRWENEIIEYGKKSKEQSMQDIRNGLTEIYAKRYADEVGNG